MKPTVTFYSLEETISSLEDTVERDPKFIVGGIIPEFSPISFFLFLISSLYRRRCCQIDATLPSLEDKGIIAIYSNQKEFNLTEFIGQLQEYYIVRIPTCNN